MLVQREGFYGGEGQGYTPPPLEKLKIFILIWTAYKGGNFCEVCACEELENWAHAVVE